MNLQDPLLLINNKNEDVRFLQLKGAMVEVHKPNSSLKIRKN
jgi:hypothetical protein